MSAHLALVSAGHSEFAIYLPAGDHQTVRFAAAELQGYIARIAGATLPVQEGVGRRDCATIAVARSREAATELLATPPSVAASESFRLRVTASGVLLAGQRPRSLLYAVYSLLHQLGCRWLGPGDEVIPREATVRLDHCDKLEAPAFPSRYFCEDCLHIGFGDPIARQRQADDDRLYVDWLAKARISGFYPFRWNPSDSSADDILDEIERRDLELVGGGHVIPPFLPARLFAAHPEYFRMDASGRRVASGNLCVSNAEALAIVCQAAVDHVRARPHLARLNVWGEDVRGGSWCSCPACRTLTAQDQYVTVGNAVVAAMRREGLRIPVVLIAYYDSLEPDLHMSPDPELHLLFAPRQRCYLHALDDPACERNRWHRENLERWSAIFPGDRLATFEYYGDSVLYRSFGIAIPGTILSDLRYYRRLGVASVTEHSISASYSSCAHPLNFLVFAAASWNPQLSLDECLDDYCRHAYGQAAGVLNQYWRCMEAADGPLVTYGDITDPPMLFDETMRQTIARVRAARGALDHAGRYLEQALACPLDAQQRGRVLRDRAIWAFTANQTAGLVEHLLGLSCLAEAERSHLANLAAQEPDGSYTVRNVATNEIMRLEYPEVPYGYMTAAAHFEKAIEIYQQGNALLAAAPGTLGESTWITAPTTGVQGQQHALLRELQVLKERAMVRLRAYQRRDKQTVG